MAQQYLRQQIEQAGPIEQVLMLYDGAVRFLTLAKVAIGKGDIQARCNANRRAMEIVAYLLDMVNPETGGAAGKALFGIYSSMLRRMLQVDFDNSVVVCDELIANLRNLRTGMAQGLAQQQGVKPQAATVVAAPGSTDAVPEGVRRNAVA
jgi:flagellar protein FliS